MAFDRWITALFVAASLGLAPGPAPARAGDPDDITGGRGVVKLQWNCPETQEGLSDVVDVPVPVNITRGTFDLSAVDRLIARAASSHRETDYSDCFGTMSGATSLPEGYEEQKDLWEEVLQRIRTAVNAKAALYRAAIRPEGALSPFEPAGVDATYPASDIPSDVEYYTRECGVGMTSDALDRRVLELLPKYTPLMSVKCRRLLSDAFARLLLASQPAAKVCAKQAARCEKRRKAVARATELLTRAGLLEETVPSLLAPPPPNQSSCPGPSVEVAAIPSLNEVLAEASESKMQCWRRKPGQAINLNRAAVGTPLASRYTLKRLPDQTEGGKTIKRYQAFLNLEFTGGTEDERFALREKAKACWEEIKPKLRSENGDRLEILPYDPLDKTVPRPPLVKIAVMDANGRSHAEAWETDVDCPTIVHESFHLLSLVDKYREASLGTVVAANDTAVHVVSGGKYPDYNCRIQGPNDSIMALQWIPMNNAIQKKRITACFCSAKPDLSQPPRAKVSDPAEQAPCEKLRASQSVMTGTCPAGTFEESFPAAMNYPESGETRLFSENGLYGFVLEAIPGPKPPKDTLLYPAEFRAITEPGCEDVNRIYYRCAREAYKTSPDHFGSTPCAVSLPEECLKGGDAWLK